ncbi:MAG: lamin tail domain-containing protein, partial [Caldilinea sp.]|nr:lamin tail domain-containing protein [Caldilinea sp.]
MHLFQRAAGAAAAGVVLAAVLLFAVTGTAAAQDEPAAAAGQTDLRINEIMASNDTTLVDPDEPDETPDWIELYNPTASPVSLTGMALTDDPADPTKHVITQSLTIPADGFLILYADNDPKQGPAHLSFGLSAAGEHVGLYQVGASGVFTKVDEIDFPALPTDISYARSIDGDGTWEISRPTPGKSNSI